MDGKCKGRIKMYCFRITKYNPQNRDKNGHYKKNEWTSFSDIGKEFEGVKLELDSYLFCENAYINAITRIMTGNNLNSIKIEGLEKHDYTNFANLPDVNVKQYFKSLKNNMDISISEVDLIARLVLREMIWCKLVSERMFVHFGYDYYMYVGSEKQLENELSIIKNNGLFVEQMPSPYMQDNDG